MVVDLESREDITIPLLGFSRQLPVLPECRNMDTTVYIKVCAVGNKSILKFGVSDPQLQL